MSESLRYPAQIFFSEEDEGYIAIALDLPGCSAFGENAEEALRELQHAIKAWVGAAKKAGNPIPRPSAPPDQDLPSGKVLARLPRTLHAQLIERANRDGSSLNTCLIMLLSQALAEKKPQHEYTVGGIAVGGAVDVTLKTAGVTYTGYAEAFAPGVTISQSTGIVDQRRKSISTGDFGFNLAALSSGKPVAQSQYQAMGVNLALQLASAESIERATIISQQGIHFFEINQIEIGTGSAGVGVPMNVWPKQQVGGRRHG